MLFNFIRSDHSERPIILPRSITRNLIPRFLLIFVLVLLAGYTKVLSQSANLDQIRNGALGVYSPTPAADWVNGNAGPQNAHFAEGYSIPYRARIEALVGTSTTVHHLLIEWDTKDQNGHAIDYITHYQNLDNPQGSHLATFGHTNEVIDPTLGTSFTGAPTLFPILAPGSTGSEVAGLPTSSFNNLPTAGYTNNANATKMAIWGGTIQSITYLQQDAPDATTGSTHTSIDIAFTSADGATALIAWGGHIAAEYDWGAGRGATGVNGSPYHTRVLFIDGKPGGQDRSLKATAVIIPPPLCGISAAQLACPETTSLSFSATGSSTGSNVSYVWTLTNGSPSAGAKIDGSNTGFSITVKPVGATFIPGGTFNLSLTVTKTGAQPTTCTRVPAGTIQNVVVTASASPTNVDILSSAHNSVLTANIGAASTDPNNANYDYIWSVVTAGTTGLLTNSATRIATYTAGSGDAGSTIQFRVIATQKSAPNCKDTDYVSINLNAAGQCSITAQGPVCQGATTTHTASPNPKPATATYNWSLTGYLGVGATSSSFAANSTQLLNNGGVTVSINATQSYRIVINEVYQNSDFNTSCFKDVQVDPTPSISTQYVGTANCTDRYFEVNVLSPTIGFTYNIKQNNNLSFASITPTVQNPAVQFTNLVPGDGYLVTVTSSLASCINRDNCGNVPVPQAREASPETIVKEGTPDMKEVQRGNKEPVTGPQTVSVFMPSSTKVNAVPNPYNDRIRFSVTSGISGNGSLELYDLLGQKVAVVYQGYVQAGKEMTFNYSALKNKGSSLIYVFKVGDQRVTGKLLSSQ